MISAVTSSGKNFAQNLKSNGVSFFTSCCKTYTFKKTQPVKQTWKEKITIKEIKYKLFYLASATSRNLWCRRIASRKTRFLLNWLFWQPKQNIRPNESQTSKTCRKHFTTTARPQINNFSKIVCRSVFVYKLVIGNYVWVC